MNFKVLLQIMKKLMKIQKEKKMKVNRIFHIGKSLLKTNVFVRMAAAFFVFCLIQCYSGNSGWAEIVQLTSGAGNEMGPIIRGSKIIYTSDRNGNKDIFEYDLDAKQETAVSLSPGNESAAAMYYDEESGNYRAVYESDRNGNQDIFMAEFNAELRQWTETQITSRLSRQSSPVIYKDKIAYVDDVYDNEDIFIFDLSIGIETQLTTNLRNQNSPSIYGDYLVYLDRALGIADITVYDMRTHHSSRVTPYLLAKSAPYICKNKIVWQESREGKLDIFMYDLETKSTSQITNTPTNEWNPKVYDNIILWEDDRNDPNTMANYDIYMYDLSTGMEAPVSTHLASQGSISVYKDKIVWQDNRSGNYDIYMSTSTILPRQHAITSISPSRNFTQWPSFVLKVYGANFGPGYSVYWNGQERPTTYISPSQLTAEIPGSDLAYAGTATITVVNAASEDLAVSNSKNFKIIGPTTTPPVPPVTPELPDSELIPDSYTKLLINFNGENGSVDFTDASEPAKVISANGDVKMDANNYKFGTAAAYFDGEGDYLNLPDSDDWNFGAEDFTIDFWAKFNSLPTVNNPAIFYQQFTDGSNYTSFGIYCIDSKYQLVFVAHGGVNVVITPDVDITADTWYHLAVVRYGSSWKLFLDGLQVGDTVDDSGTMPDYTGKVGIGAYENGSCGFLNGWIDDFRVSKGIARGLGSTQPSMPAPTPIPTPTFDLLPTDSYTKFLMHFDGADIASALQDSSGTDKVVTAYGDFQIGDAQGAGIASGLFNGTDSYLDLPDSDDWNFGNGNFTIDFWIKFNSTSGDQTIISQYEDSSNYWGIGKNSENKLLMYFYDEATYKGRYTMASPSSISADTWYHLAFVRSGTTGYIFINGVSQTLTESTAFETNDLGDMGAALTVGKINSGQYVNGWIDELRVSKGIARKFGIDTLPPTPSEILLPAEVFVDDNYNADDCGGHVWQLNAFHNINDAVDNVYPYGTVNVAAGIYNLTSPVSIDKPLSIMGDIVAPSNVIVKAPTSTPGNKDNDCFQIRSSEVSIEGFKVTDATDRYVRSDGNAGIDIGGYRTGYPIGGLKDIFITHNKIFNNAYGIYVYAAQNVVISSNQIYESSMGNYSGHWTGKGIVLYGSGIAPNHIEDIRILNNEIYGNKSMGIEINNNLRENNIWKDTGIIIDGNKIYNNGAELNHDGEQGYAAQGIVMRAYTQQVAITNNQIYDHFTRPERFYKNTSGIKAFNSRNLTISDNIIRQNMRGIYIHGSNSSGSKIENNNIFGNAQGIVFEDAAAGSINENSIHDNNIDSYIANGINPCGVLNLYRGQLDATNNWWGAADGPKSGGTGSGEKVEGNINYASWYLSEERSSSSDNLLVPTLWGISITADATSRMPQEYTRNLSVNVSIEATGVLPIEQLMLSEKRDFSGAKWQPFTAAAPVVSFTLSAGQDGIRTVYCKVKDNSQKESQVMADFITLDTEPPEAEFIGLPGFSHPEHLTNANSTDITVTGEGVFAYRYKLDKETIYLPEKPVGEAISRERLADGPHSLYLVAIDAAGNPAADINGGFLAENIVRYDWTVDTTRPTGVRYEGLESGVTFSTTYIRILVGAKEGEDDVVDFEYRIDGKELKRQRMNTLITELNFEPGSHKVEIYAIDRAENRQLEPTVINWNVAPTVNPKPKITGYAPKQTIGNTTKEGVAFDFTATATDSSDPLFYYWKVDGRVEQGPNPDDPSSGINSNTFTYTPGYGIAPAGGYRTQYIELVVSDGVARDITEKVFQVWELTVTDVDLHPTVVPAPSAGDRTVKEGKVSIFAVDAVDPRGLPLSYAWSIDGITRQSPDFNNINSNQFTYTPDYGTSTSDANTVHTVAVLVSNGEGEFNVSTVWRVTVEDVNTPPALAAVLPVDERQLMHEGSSLKFCAFASDNEDPQLSFRWILDSTRVLLTREYSGVALGARVSDSCTYSPDFNSAGSHTIRVEVSDGQVCSNYEWQVSILDKEDVLSWDFNLDGQTLGWDGEGSLKQPVVSGGVYKAAFEGVQPILASPGLRLDAQLYQALRVRYRASAPDAVKGGLSWSALKPGGDKDDIIQGYQEFSIIADGKAHVVDIDLSANPGWSGTITGLKLLPVISLASGNFEIDYIRILEGPPVLPPEWGFNTDNDNQGWVARNSLGPLVIKDGIASTSVLSNDPRMDISTGLSIDADIHKGVELRYRLSQRFDASGEISKEIAELFWRRADGTQARCELSDIIPDGQMHIYTVDLSDIPEWRGEVVYLRFDPTATPKSIGSRVEIDYIKIVTNPKTAPRWEFNRDYNAGGWSIIDDTLSPLDVREGILYTAMNKADPRMEIGARSPNPLLSINADNYKVVSIRMKVNNGRTAKLIWKNSRGWSNYSFSLVKGDFYTYNIDLSGIPSWSGNIFYLRFDPIDIEGIIGDAIEIDYIRILDNIGIYWEFTKDNDTLGWIRPPVAGDKGPALSELEVSSGRLKADILTPDPYIINSTVNFPAADYPYLQIKYKNNSQDIWAQIFWNARDEDGVLLNGAKKENFLINSDGLFHVYDIDLRQNPGWKGQITHLRFDPINTKGSGKMEIEYIRFLKHKPVPEPQEWFFDSEGNVQGWRIAGGNSSIKAEGGNLIATLSGVAAPHLLGPFGQEIDAGIYKTAEIRMKVSGSSDYFPSLRNARLKLYWYRAGERFDEERSAAIPIKADSKYYTYELKLDSNQNWSGQIRLLKILPLASIPEFRAGFSDGLPHQVEVYIDHIRFKE